jgi:hypothetical protein
LTFFLYTFLMRSQPVGMASPALCAINSPFSGFLKKLLATVSEPTAYLIPSRVELEPTSWLATENLRVLLLLFSRAALLSLVLEVPLSWSLPANSAVGLTPLCLLDAAFGLYLLFILTLVLYLLSEVVFYLRKGLPDTTWEPRTISV